MISETHQHILVIDDHMSFRDALSEVFRFQGYRVTAAASGPDGLNSLDMVPRLPDLILVDIRMPNMNGYQFLQTVRTTTQWQHIPVLLMSGQWAADALNLPDNAQGYVQKPFNVQELLTLVSDMIASNECG